jgi:hypothetical protein
MGFYSRSLSCFSAIGFLTTIIVLFGACNRQEHLNLKITSALDSFSFPIQNSKYIKVTYSNTGQNSFIVWHWALGEPNFLNAKTMLASILDSTLSETKLAYALWRFASKSGFHYSYPYNHKLKDNLDPISLVTFPYFLCGEKSGILANLANLAGLKSRVITMDGHIVTEIFCDGSWSMFDADENVVFVNQSMKPYSIAQLAINPKLICRENVLKSVEDKFTGFSNYKTYMEGYQPNERWINESYLIEHYTARSMGVKLFPIDSISFELNEAILFKRLFNKRYKYESKGVLYRQIHKEQIKTQGEDNSIIFFEDTIPYYIKSILVAKPFGSPIEAFMVVQNRITQKFDTVATGKLNQKNELVTKFNAPSDSCIYYSYRLGIKGCTPNEINQIRIKIEFEFNQLVFPYSKEKTILVSKEGGGELKVHAEFNK